MKTKTTRRRSPPGERGTNRFSQNGSRHAPENEIPSQFGRSLILLPQPLSPSLSEKETKERDECECIISRGWDTFLEVGQALSTIRNNRLYRDHHETFEEYCQSRWEFSKSHANRLIEASVVAALLTPIGVKPTSESQLRPLVGLAPQKIHEAWKKAEELAAGKDVTARVVRIAAQLFKPGGDRPKSVTAKSKLSVTRARLGSAIKLISKLDEAARKNDTQALLEGLSTLHQALTSWLPAQSDTK